MGKKIAVLITDEFEDSDFMISNNGILLSCYFRIESNSDQLYPF